MSEISPVQDELDDQSTIYYFASGINPGEGPLVELTKSWPQGQQTLIVGRYDRFHEALDAEMELVELKADQGLEPAMREAERRAVDAGELDPQRADPRLFTEGPPDPFKTERQEALEANMGYYFRAGPALDQGETVEAYSLNLVNVEREGAEYRFAQVEYLRVDVQDAGYIDDAAGKFNHLMGDHGVGPAVSAASTWAREHGAELPLEWRDVDATQLDRQHQPTTHTLDMDTQPLPAVTRDEVEL